MNRTELIFVTGGIKAFSDIAYHLKRPNVVLSSGQDLALSINPLTLQWQAPIFVNKVLTWWKSQLPFGQIYSDFHSCVGPQVQYFEYPH